MTISDVLAIVVPVLAVLLVIAAAAFIIRAVINRPKPGYQAYNVERLQTRRSTRIDLIRGVLTLLLALVLLALFALGPGQLPFLPAVTAPSPPPSPTATRQLSLPTATATPAPIATPTPAATATPLAPAASPTPEPTATATPAPPSATVSAEAGVWLRSAPSLTSQQLQWLLQGTQVYLLPGAESDEELDWQEVRTLDGVEGWVAMEYLSPNQE